jgi:micrococcal nuclease
MRWAVVAAALLLVACPSRGDDDDSTLDPNFDAALLPQGPTPPHVPIAAEVLSITDGDTGRFRLDDGTVRNVRFLSIDTPEMNATNSDPPECYAQEATDRTSQLLPPGTRVWLTWDGELQDSFDRLLCYIFVGQTPSADEPYDDWINLTLVEEGYARAYIFDNNQTWRSTFEGAEQAARNGDLGRWGTCGFR